LWFLTGAGRGIDTITLARARTATARENRAHRSRANVSIDPSRRSSCATGAGGENGASVRDRDENSRDAMVDATRLDAAQRALRDQLEARMRALDAKSLDTSRALRAARREREDVGVELYALQGAVASLRAEWVAADETMRRGRDARVLAESDTCAREEEASGALRALEAATARTRAKHVELDASAMTLRACGETAAERESDAEVMRRVVEATSNAVEAAEQERLERERRVSYVKGCVERAKVTLSENLEAVAACERDTADIRSRIEACDQSIFDIDSNATVVHARWRQTLKDVGKEDEALQACRSEICELDERRRLLDIELEEVRASISREHATKTACAETIHTLEKDIKTADALIVSLRAAIDDKKLQSDAAHADARRHEDHIRAEERRTHEIGMEIERVDKAYVAHTHALHDVQENALLQVAEKMTTNKLAQKLTQAMKDFSARSRSISHESIVVRHEIAQTKLHTVRIAHHEESIRGQLRIVETGVTSRQAAIDLCESEIAQNMEEIEKSTVKVDEANKELEKIYGISPEHLGPLEAEIAHLRNDIKTNEANCTKLRHVWLRAQCTILDHGEKSRQALEIIDRVEKENDVLLKKRDRYQRKSFRDADECRAIEKNVSRQRCRLSVLDEKLSRTEDTKRDNALMLLTAEDVRASEIDSLSGNNIKLRAEIHHREEAVRSAYADGERFDRDIAEMERRIQHERQAQIMLNPTKGNVEVASAQKENAKLAVVLRRLESRRNNVAAQVESSVKRRELIVAKGDAIQANIEADGEERREAEMVATAKRAQSDVTRRLKDVAKSTSELKSRVLDLETARGDIDETYTQLSKLMADLVERRERFRVGTITHLREKYEHALLSTSSQQKIAHALKRVRERRESSGTNEEDAHKYTRAIERLKEVRGSLLTAIREEINNHPHLSHGLKRARSLLTAV